MSTTYLNKKDWFEFLLDFNLLDRHLSNAFPDPPGCSLIILFMYKAFLNSSPTQPNEPNNTTVPNASPIGTPSAGLTISQINTANRQIEIKTKRIRVLRILAVKTASILDWNLLTFEKEIPIAVMSDLLDTFLKITMKDKETRMHYKLDVKKLDNYALFALQVLHRWSLRTVIFSKFPKKPPTKSISVNLPGTFIPLQNIAEANESVLQALISSVKESVLFLENFINSIDYDICKPLSECFANLNSENGTYDLLWEKAECLNINQIKNYINYDLGMYYFQAEDYSKALPYFVELKEYKEICKSENKDLTQLNEYSNDLDGYIIATKSMLNLEINEEPLERIVKPNEVYGLKLSKKVTQIEKAINKNDFNEILNCLLEDNKSCQLSYSYRLNIEKLANEQNADQTIIDQIASCNLAHFASESTYYNYLSNLKDNFKYFAQVINSTYDKLSLNSKENLFSFIQFNASKLNSITIKELAKNKNFSRCFSESTINTAESEVSESTEMETDLNDDINNTPSSPPPSSSLINTLNYKDNNALTYAKLSLQTCDSIALRNCISNYNMNSQGTSLRYFWPDWKKMVALTNPNSCSELESSNFIGNIIKSNSTNDLDFFYICYAKVNQLIESEKFECAFKMLKAYEEMLSQNGKSHQIYLNQQLYLLIKKYLNDFDFLLVDENISNISAGSGSSSSSSNSLLQTGDKNTQFLLNSKEKIQKYSKKFLLSTKYDAHSPKTDSDVAIEVFKLVLVFLLSIGNYNFLLSNEFSFFSAPQQTSGKKSSSSIHNSSSLTFLFNLSKQISKLCIELNKPSEKNAGRKLARELWDTIVDLFTDSMTTTSSTTNKKGHESNQQTNTILSTYDASNPTSLFSSSAQTTTTSVAIKSSSNLNRELIREFLTLIKDKLIRNVIISLFSTLYNIGDTTANIEIYSESEYRHLWPSSLANMSSLNLNSLMDVLNSIMHDSINVLNPLNTSWLCTNADICLAKGCYSDTIKYLLQMFACETDYFFNTSQLLIIDKQQTNSKKTDSHKDDRFIEKNIKSMIRSCSQLNKHTQAALLCQFLNTNINNNNDYSNAFRFLQEGNIIVPTSDEMDLLYNCIWDISLLEYITNLNAVRGFIDKRNVCLKLCASQNLNIYNPSEVYQKTVECKKAQLFSKLINYYFL